MTNILKSLIISLLLVGNASATTYYIAANGLDANNGTSKSTPWLHAPGMFGATGNPYAYTPQAGDQFILRGGDTWYSNGTSKTPVGVPWQWIASWNGTSSSRIYIGVDKTWYAGASWTKPVLSGGNPLNTNFVSSCTYHIVPSCYLGADNGKACSSDSGCGAGQCALDYLRVHWAQYVTVDNIEFTGMCSDASQEETYLQASQSGSPTQNNIYENLYMHGWTMTTLSATQQNDGIGIIGDSSGAGSNQFLYNTIDGTDSYPYAFQMHLWDCYDVENSTYRYAGQGIVCNNNHIFHNNLIELIYNTTKPSAHSNGFEFNSEYSSAGANLIYNNIVRNCTAAVTTWIQPNTSVNTYFYNNLIYGNIQQAVDVDTTNGGNTYFINNTFESNSQTPIGGGSALTNGTFYIYNNHCINTAGACAKVSGATINNLTNLVETETVSTAAGYTTSNLYMPTSASSPTVRQGTNEYFYSTTDILGNSRPSSGAWDIGAYEFKIPSAPTMF